jgi:hypothetical protein
MLSLFSVRLMTLQETTTVSGTTSGKATFAVGSFASHAQRIKDATKSDFHIARTRSRLQREVYRVRPP